MSVEVKIIPHAGKEYLAAFALRNEVLRKPLNLSLNREDMESEKDQVHFVLKDGDSVIGCVILIPEKEKIKLRQMAVHPDYQGKGLGQDLLNSAEKYAIEKGFQVINCHARKTALNFYKKNHWLIEGEEFEEVGIPHYKMFKVLK